MYKSLENSGEEWSHIITLEADVHMHTLVSGHAYGTIREMIHAARERNLKLIGISELGPGTSGTTDPFYFVNLQVIPGKIEVLQLLHGC